MLGVHRNSIFSRLCALGLFIVLAIAGCAQNKTCQSAIEGETYAEAELICALEYQKSGAGESLSGWIRALGEQDKLSEIADLILTIDDDVIRADAMLGAAKYERRARDLDSAQRYHLGAAAIYLENQRYESQAQALHQAFRMAWFQSDHRAALRFAEKSLSSARKANSVASEFIALNDLARVFLDIGSLDAAQFSLTLSDKKITPETSLGWRVDRQVRQGLVHLDQGKFGLASHDFEQALSLVKDSNNSASLKALHLNIAYANIELTRFDQAAKHLELAQSYVNVDGSRQFSLWYYRALLYFRRGEFSRSFEAIGNALDDPSLPDVWLWEVHYLAGEAAHGMGQTSLAVNHYRRSIESGEKLQEEIGFDNLKAHLLNRKREPYEALFLAYFEDGDFLNAFAVSERAKSKSFIESLVQSESTRASEQITPDFLTTGLNVQAESDRIDELMQHLNLMRTSPVVELQDARTVLSSLKGRSVISFFVAQDRLFLLSAVDGDIEIAEADLPYVDLQTLVFAYKENPSDQSILARLGEALVAKFLESSAAEHLYISPDNALSDIAFSSLIVNHGFLIESAAISIIPSASALVKVAEHNDSINTKAASSFTLIGDPEGDLPAAQLELLEVYGMLESYARSKHTSKEQRPVITVLNNDAAEFSALLDNKAPDILHVASHSGVSHLGPWLRFADGDIPSSAILKGGLAPKLTVLASCNSGVKDGKNLWGSLGGAFLSSGSAAALVTLRSVQDTLTHQLVKEFYHNYLAGADSAQALALAQRQAIKNNIAPSQWGAFTLLGEPTIGFDSTRHLSQTNRKED